MQSFSQIVASKKSVHPWQCGLTALGGITIAAGLVFAHPSSANAQAAYGSYIGIGPSFGVTEGARYTNEDSKEVSGVLAIRYKFLEAPISLRTQILIGDGTAVVPTVSYDLPISYRADAYVGVGASIVTNSRDNTPVGNKTSFAIQPGIDYALPNSGFVVFGNAIIAIDAYKEGGNTAVSLQGGLGLRF